MMLRTANPLLNALALLLPTLAAAQDYVTPGQYAFTVESDIVYGADTDYLGLIDTLELDLYKPLGNADPQRPLLVLAHGGSWLAGCKHDPLGVVPTAIEFVQRGYVVASINYRLGWHKAEFVSGNVAGYGISPWPASSRALYALDSAEIKRAIFRGQQDMKAAVRFLKARAALDSVCAEKVFMGGESAGGFVALAAAFLDRAEERPDACAEQPDAPEPYSLFLNLTTFNCQNHEYTVTPAMRARPDLGSVEGALNQNGHDARVRGVANFYGGLPAEAFTQDWWQGADTPAVYLYHQTCDGIVMHNQGRPMSIISGYCNLGAAPWHHRYPTLRGSGAIANAFAGMATPPTHHTDFQPCAPFDPSIALLDCIRYSDNGSYHYVSDRAERCQQLATFWAPIAGEAGACLGAAIPVEAHPRSVRAVPLPAHDRVRFTNANGPATIVDGSGRAVLHLADASLPVDVSALGPGAYIAVIRARTGILHSRFVVAR